jgi:beige protein homolog 1
MAEQVVRRERSSTAASTASNYHNNPITADLRALVESLSETSNGVRPPSVGVLRIQCDDFRRIRSILINNGSPGQAKDAFRHVGGFQLLIKVLRSVSGFYDAARLSRDERTDLFELVKAVLDVLSEAIEEHQGNRRYFANRVEDGGWKALEEALASTGVVTASSNERNEDDTGQAHLFGSLVAFALGEETIRHIFRSMRKPSEEPTKSQSNTNDAEQQPEEESTKTQVKELQKQLRHFLGGKETLSNPEIVPIIVNFCWTTLHGQVPTESESALAIAVALSLKEIASFSIRNQVAMHSSGTLSILLPVVFGEEKESITRSLFRDLAGTLIAYGINELHDARYIFRLAATSDEAAEFVLQGMQSSRTPPFIQFDLSTNGYSCIELPTLGKTFPPTSNSNGYTLAAWVRIDKFDPDVHTTLFGAYDSSQTCFILAYLENDTRHFILQTSVKSSKPSVRFRSQVFQEGLWYHIAIVHRRPRTTSSSKAALFVNGIFMEQIRCHYPSSPPSIKHARNRSTDSFASLASTTDKHSAIQAFLGTPQDLALRLGQNVVKSKWSLASFHLWSEALSDELIAVIEKLGPRYDGNFQDSLGSFLTYQCSAELNRHNELLHPGQEEKSDILSALHSKTGLILPEYRLLLSFFPSAVLDNEDRNHVNEARLIKSLSKEAGRMLQRLIRAGGNSVIINAAIPSFNEALTQPHGVAILTGDPVAVVPQSLDDACWRVAGTASIGLKLVELAKTRDQVLRAVRTVFASIEDSWRNSEAMEKENGFGVLAGLLREKLGFGSIFEERAPGRLPTIPVDPSEREELALELLRICLKFVGYDEQNPEESLINNPLAYRSLFVDFDTWRRTPIATQKLYWSQFVHFAGKSRNLKFNSKRLIKMRIIKRFLDALKGETFSVDVFPDFIEAFSALFACNMTSENLRSLALFITYAFQDNRAFPTHTTRTKKAGPRPSNNGPKTLDSERSTPRSLSPGYNVDLGPTLPRYEVGVQVLEMYLDLICDPNHRRVTEKFAKTVTNKWLLFMLDEPDPRVVFITMKILGRVMFMLGPQHVREYFVKKDMDGFVILKQRLKVWWNMPAIWIVCFALLFGHDVTTINFDVEFNHFNLAEIFSQRPVIVVYPEIFPVITAMLEHGLRAIVQDSEGDGTNGSSSARPGNSESTSTPTKKDAENAMIHRLTSDADILQTVVRFLTDLHLKWPSFREFTVQSNYVQDLLFVLYPVVVTSDSVSAETELNSRGSGLNFEGQDVVIRPHATSENQRPPIVRTSAVDTPPSPSTQRAMPFRRASSFILITSDNGDRLPPHARFNAVMSPTTPQTVSLRVGHTVVEGLLQVVLGVFLDQVLERKEFMGFGLFHKVPPGFQEHQVYFESYVLSHAMSLLSNNLRLNQKLLTEPKVLTNIARYTLYMADAVFEGWFLEGADPLLDFVGNQLEYLQQTAIAKLKNVRLCSQAIVNMRVTFLRIALLRLSELDGLKNEQEAIAFLQKMTYWQTIILSTESAEHNFLRLIFYLLYMKLVSNSTTVRLAAVNFWRLLLVQKPDEARHVLLKAAGEHRSYLPEGFMRLAQVNDDTFFLWVDKNREDLDQIFFGAMSKYWEDFVHEENRKTEETASNRITKRRETLKAWHLQETNVEDQWRKHEIRTSHWRNNVYTAERVKHQRSMQDQQDVLTSMAATVEKMDSILKGPVGLFEEESRPKWRLDETEGYWRMRMRVVHDKTTLQDDYQPKRKTGDSARKASSLRLDTNVKIVSSRDIVGATPSTPKAQALTILEPGRQRSASAASQSSVGHEEEYEIIDDPREDEDGFEDKNRKVMRAIRPGDVIQVIYNVSRIVGLEACEGLLILGKSSLYLMDHFFQRADGEVLRVWQAPEEERDPYLRMISGKETKTKKPRLMPGERTSRHWRWSDVMLISKRRFLFRDVAIEIFFTDGQSFLLTAISPEIRDDLHAKLTVRAPLVKDPSAAAVSEDGWRLESLRHPEEGPQSLGSKFAIVFNSLSANPATRKWVKGEMSNFAYLTLVNTMAGRTFNDLTQYPVFPWVLADYTSEELDLTDPRTFRDLSKPMGCQIPSREAEFRERYQAFTEMGDHNAPPFHYGTHYSSAMIVSSYLIRLQPFVQSYLLLQGGSFDHADRLFYSIERAWLSASRDNMTDVRELTPEFFYLPEFLTNINGYNFGQRQNTGEIINDVVLPPWAKGDPHIFIQKHREALESPYVSMHLHKWIDLVFGFKQRGEAAIEATNVFHHLSYHGAKDLDAITDPVERLATIGIIHNFGQTPHQVFTRAHPQREETSPRYKTLESAAEGLRGTQYPLYETPERIKELLWHPKLERVFHTSTFRVFIPPTFDKFVEFGYADATMRFFSADSKKQIALYEHFHLGQISCTTFVDSRTMVTAGADAVVTVWTVTYPGKSGVEPNQRFSLFGHRHPVVALAASKALSALVSADAGGRVLVWDLTRGEFVRELLAGRGDEIRELRIHKESGEIAMIVGRRVVRIFSLNGKAMVEFDVCRADNGNSDDEGYSGQQSDDEVTCLQWSAKGRGEWTPRRLLVTGHRSGAVKLWKQAVSKEGSWTLELVKRLRHPGPQGNVAPIMAVLPLTSNLVAADENGRVVSFPLLVIFPSHSMIWVANDSCAV